MHNETPTFVCRGRGGDADDNAFAALAQTASAATSPELHAFFEVEYARQATYMSLDGDHRHRVMAIAEAMRSGTISYDTAVQQINGVLTPREQQSVLEVESSFWGALRGMARSQSAALLVIPQIDAGQFLLFLFDVIHT